MPADIPPPIPKDMQIDLTGEYREWSSIRGVSVNTRLLYDHALSLFRRCHAAEAERDRLRADLAEAVEALAWASNEAKGRLPDWFHAIVAKHKGNA